MIKDLLLVNNDLKCEHDIDTVSDVYALLQCAVQNLNIAYGEIMIDETRGNKALTRRVKLTDVDLQQMADDCKQAILWDVRIKNVPSLTIKRNGLVNCDISFTMTTVDGLEIQGNSTISLT